MKLGCVLMAAGRSERFGGNKLLEKLGDKTVIEHTFDSIPTELLYKIVVVTIYSEIEKLAKDRGFICIKYDGGPAGETIRMGMLEIKDDIDGCMFCVCDQPLRTKSSIEGLIHEFLKHPTDIVAMSKSRDKNTRGNPVIFPKDCFDGLCALVGEQSGGEVINENLDRLRCFVVEDGLQFADIDTKNDLEKLKNNFRQK